MVSVKLLDNINVLSRSVSSLQKIFDCPICLDVLEDPVRTTVCGHTFCKKCINHLLKTSLPKKPCPLCNAALTHRSVVRDEKMSTFLNLTLELLTAINLDTGIDVSEHRCKQISTNEASEDSEEFFLPKRNKPYLSVNTTKHTEKLNQKNNSRESREFVKKKPSNEQNKNNIKSYLTKNFKVTEPTKETTLKSPRILLDRLFKKPFTKDVKISEGTGKNKDLKLDSNFEENSIVRSNSNENLLNDSVNNELNVNNLSDTDKINDNNKISITDITENPDISVKFTNDNELCVSETGNQISDSVITKSMVKSKEDDEKIVNKHVEVNKNVDDFLHCNKSDLDKSKKLSENNDNVGNPVNPSENNITNQNSSKLDKTENVGNSDKPSVIKLNPNANNQITINFFSNDSSSDSDNDNRISINVDNSNKNHRDKIPFIIFGKTKRRHKSKSYRPVPYLLLGGLEKSKKRKFNSDSDSDSNEEDDFGIFNFCSRCDKTNNDKVNGNKGVSSSHRAENFTDIGIGSENVFIEKEATSPPTKKRCLVSVSVQTSPMKNYLDCTRKLTMTDESMMDVDIFDYENDLNLNKDRELEEMKSISQMPVCNELSTSLNKHTSPTMKNNVQLIEDDNDDDSNDAATIINQNIQNKDKIKFCQRETINFKTPFSKNRLQEQKLDKSSKNNSNLSVITNENVKTQNNFAMFDKSVNKTITENNKNDVSVNEIENSEPVCSNASKGFLNKIKTFKNDGVINSFLNKENTSNVQSNSTNTDEVFGAQQKDNRLSEETPAVSGTLVDIIEASDEEDDDDNVLPTPPILTNMRMDLGVRQSQLSNLQNSVDHVINTDSETNEIPSSLTDSHIAKTFINHIVSDVTPSSIDQTITDNIISINKNKSTNNQPIEENNKHINDIMAIEINDEVITNEDEINSFDMTKRNSNISFVCSRLTDTQLKELKVLAFRVSADITNDIVDGMTTHVIIRPVKGNRAPHTFKFLKGIASRLWVVSVDWVIDCLKAQKLLPEEKYLVLNSSGEPGPLRCKQPSCDPPLVRFIIVPMPPYTSTTVEQVKDLSVLCGGEIAELEVLEDIKYKFGVPRILLLDCDSDQDSVELWLEKYRLVPLNVEWLLEVVGRYQLVPINEYMIAPLPKELLHYLVIPDEIIADEDEDYSEDKEN